MGDGGLGLDDLLTIGLFDCSIAQLFNCLAEGFFLCDSPTLHDKKRWLLFAVPAFPRLNYGVRSG